METLTPSLQFITDLTSFQATISRRFDGRLGVFHGIGLSEFIILYHLHEAPEQKMRRIDLAEKLGLTPSGVTRLLAPMEKIGLVSREANAQDARVSLVSLALGGKRVFTEALYSAEELAAEIMGNVSLKDAKNLISLLR